MYSYYSTIKSIYKYINIHNYDIIHINSAVCFTSKLDKLV